MDLPADALRHVTDDHVVWITTVTDSGAPAPFPVWFVPDGDDLLVFSQPSARRVHNIGARPRVSLNFNSDAHGGDAWIIDGTATLRAGVAPSTAPGYLDKYRASIEGELKTTVEAIDATYDTEIRVRPIKVRTI
jgi:PPOX class probable F420-dependent enzyme